MTEQMHIKPEILDELIKGYQNPEDLIGENGLLKQLTKALLERAMNAEMTHHLGYEKGDKQTAKDNGNRRNGTAAKTVLGKNGDISITVLRDRDASFEPQIVKKRETRFDVCISVKMNGDFVMHPSLGLSSNLLV